MFTRSLTPEIKRDLKKKMVFLAGPRQSGKTTLAKSLLKEISGTYYNYDLDADRMKILKTQLDPSSKLWVFDELHKYIRWRNWIKGVFDTHSDQHRILVTGSARLDVYSRGGDSLQGRYYFYRFHPLTLGELVNRSLDFSGKTPESMIAAFFESSSPIPRKGFQETLKSLLQLGPFPEPYFSGSDREAQRWRMTYSARVIREEIRDLEHVQDLGLLELLYHRLPDCVSSPLSLNSLREDLEVSFSSVKSWLEIFDRMYLSHRISPFGPAKIKAVKKEQKLYLWDWGAVRDPGARLENLVANHLLRFAHACEDSFGLDVSLRFFRNVNGNEVDFVVLKQNLPWFCVEVKHSAKEVDPNLKYFLERVNVPYAFQIHLEGDQDYLSKNLGRSKVRVLPASTFLASLP